MSGLDRFHLHSQFLRRHFNQHKHVRPIPRHTLRVSSSYLSIGDVHAQVDVSKRSRANFPHQTIPVYLKICLAVAPTACCGHSRAKTVEESVREATTLLLTPPRYWCSSMRAFLRVKGFLRDQLVVSVSNANRGVNRPRNTFYRNITTKMAVVGGKVLVVLSICILASDALFFHISETETKCFIEEVPDETLIVGGCSDWGACLFPGYCDYSVNKGACTGLSFPLGLCVSPYSLLGKYKIQLHDENSDRWLPSSPGIGMHVEVCVCV